MRLKSIDQILLVFLFFVGTISTAMLFTREERLSNLDSLAVIVSELNTVKRKASLFDSWRDLSLGDTLQEDDQIYTHDRSEVELLFKSGKKIQLLENSLLKISKEDNRERLKLEKGILEANFNQKTGDAPLRIDLKGKTVSLESTTGIVQMESSSSGGRIFVQSGELTINDGNKSTVVRENQTVAQEKNGELGKVVDVLFTLTKPAHKLKLLRNNAGAGIPVGFLWGKNKKVPDEKISQYTHRLIISKAIDFKTIHFSQQFDLGQNNFSFDFIENGKYFWKIQSIKDEGSEILESAVRSFEVFSADPSFVLNSQNIFVKKKKPNLENDKIKIQWKNVASEWLTSHKIYIKYKNETIKEISPDKNATSSIISMTKDLLDLGFYEIVIVSQLKNHNQEQITVTSSPFVFQLIEDQIPVIKIKNPKDETIYSYKRQTYQKILSWDIISGAGNYEVDLVKDGNVILNLKTSENFIDLPLNGEGKYQWKVRPIDGENRQGEVHLGTIQLKYPKKLNLLPKSGEVLYLDTPDQEVHFKWEKNVRATSYVFELSETQDFNKTIISDETAKHFYLARLGKTGNFFWRVKMKIGGSLEYSEPVSVEVKPAPLFEKPVIEEEIKLQLQKMETSKKVPGTFKFVLKLIEKIIASTYASETSVYKVEWPLRPAKNVKSYVVEVYRDSEMSELVLKEEVSTARFVWRNASSGTFYWRLAYRDSWDRVTEFSNLSKLVIDPIVEMQEVKPQEKIEEFIVLVNPSHREELATKESFERAFEAEWSFEVREKDPAPSFKILFSSDLDFTQIFLIKEARIDGKKILANLTCEDLKPFIGTSDKVDFYWRIVNAKSNVESKRRFLTLSVKNLCPHFFPEEKLSPIDINTLPQTSLETYKDYMMIGFGPSMINVKTKGASYEAKADGVSFLSLNFAGEKYLDENQSWEKLKMHSFYGRFSLTSGKIFNTEKLQNIDFEVGSRWKKYLRVGGTFKMPTELKESNQSKVNGENVTLFGLSSALEYRINDFSFLFNLQFGNFINYGLEIQKKIKIKQIPLMLNFSYEGMSFESEKRKTSGSVLGLKIHYLFE